MIPSLVTTTVLQEQLSDAYAFFLSKEFASSDLKEIEALYPDINRLIQAKHFQANEGQELILPTFVRDKAITLMIFGIGSLQKSLEKNFENTESYRRVVGRAVKHALTTKSDSITLILPPSKIFGMDDECLGYETVLTAGIAEYHFDDFITINKPKKIHALTICALSHDNDAIQKGIARAIIVCDAVNKARHWIDLPPAFLHPISFAQKAEEIAKKQNLKITIFGEKEAAEHGMGGLLGVANGSEHECRLVVMEYRTKTKDAPTIALVGKGITFDSGGLSIKPANSMESMKDDMSGAAAVVTTMEALSKLNPDVNVIGVAALAENMPSGKATRPGDILRFYNGKTAEVKNTDAEGRLVLADALSYTIATYKPDAIIDIATLTGACAYALGPFFTGMMSQHDDLAHKVQKAGEVSGDLVWRLPMSNDYKKAIKSTVADICNIGSKSYNAGAITAAFFLKEFVGDTPWVHLDIAGSSFDVPDIPYYRPGATGVGVRLFVELITNWK